LKIFRCINAKLCNGKNLLAIFALGRFTLSVVKYEVNIQGPVTLHNRFDYGGDTCHFITWHIQTPSRSLGGYGLWLDRGSSWLGGCRGVFVLVFGRVGNIVKIKHLLFEGDRSGSFRLGRNFGSRMRCHCLGCIEDVAELLHIISVTESN
jgi:hypothetical protein